MATTASASSSPARSTATTTASRSSSRPSPMRLLAISGSLRRDSYNTQLLRAAGELAPRDLGVELYDGLAQIPPYDSDEEALGAPPSVADLKHRIAAADVVLI